MTHARIYLIALVIGLAAGGLAASSMHFPAPIVETQPTAVLPPTDDATESCPAPSAADALLAAGTAPNSSCPPPKTCCGWKDPGHHICNRCC